MTQQFSKIKSLVWLTSTILLMATILQNQAIAGNYISASNNYATIFLDQTNGKITVCGVLFSTGTSTMIGSCTQIGTISSTSLLGNAQISMAGPGSCVNAWCGTNATILNTATGLVSICPAWRDGNGNPVGTCAATTQIP